MLDLFPEGLPAGVEVEESQGTWRVCTFVLLLGGFKSAAPSNEGHQDDASNLFLRKQFIACLVSFSKDRL